MRELAGSIQAMIGRRQRAHSTFLSVLQRACSTPPLFFATDAEKTAISRGGGEISRSKHMMCRFFRVSAGCGEIQAFPRQRGFLTVSAWCAGFFVSAQGAGKFRHSHSGGGMRARHSRGDGGLPRSKRIVRKASPRRREFPRSKHMVRRRSRGGGRFLAASTWCTRLFLCQRGALGNSGILAAAGSFLTAST